MVIQNEFQNIEYVAVKIAAIGSFITKYISLMHDNTINTCDGFWTSRNNFL